jgi:hypothetical protein
MGDTKREATSGEVTALRRENVQLKEMLAELALQVRYFKKRPIGTDDDPDLL